jgi:uncharacterized protein YyaL (SSP411 family)
MPASRQNRLAEETSPYLLQHAGNPVDWFPWGEAAIATANELDRPIFLSIGYSACHWCHVMEHESFESETVAALMNERFVNIKVDREERPDLDRIYMNAVLALTGRGGWPMSVFLTPDLKPFFGGTYWPPEPRTGMPGFRQILEHVANAWETRRPEVLNGADELTEAVARMGGPQGEPSDLAAGLLKNAMHQLIGSADRMHGGFGGAPKFPHPMDLRVLLRCWQRFESVEALDIVRLTLDRMAGGGLYDHLGGGFHRYSTDARWLAPHFEKMLYDNALLTSVSLEAYQAMGHENDARVVRETLDYVLREMTQPEGGFYSTQDADSEGVEGKFFVWSEAEIDEHLDADAAKLFRACYDVSAAGNWEETNILNRPRSHAEMATELGLSADELALSLEQSRRTLFDIRSQRIAPSRDDKILVSWNGLMMAAMAQATQVLGEPKYAVAATKAGDFILDRMRDESGGLLHAFKDGRARFTAYLDDYAALIDGLAELYQATFETRFLTAAIELAETMLERFGDAESGGFFYTAIDHETLITRDKDSQDNATPSGNALAATGLLKLGRLCGRADFERAAEQTLQMLSGQMHRVPQASGQALIALDFLLGPTKEIVVADGSTPSDATEILASLHQQFLPNKVVLRRNTDVADDELPPETTPLLSGKTSRDGEVTVYICEQGTCGEPAVGRTDCEKVIESMGSRG